MDNVGLDLITKGTQSSSESVWQCSYSAEAGLHGKIGQPTLWELCWTLDYTISKARGVAWKPMENDIGMANDSTNEETSDNNKQYALFCNMEP